LLYWKQLCTACLAFEASAKWAAEVEEEHFCQEEQVMHEMATIYEICHNLHCVRFQEGPQAG